MENKKFKLNLTKIDFIIIVLTFVISIVLSCIIFFAPQEKNNAKVCVYYDGEIITKVDLIPSDGDTSSRYIILFKDTITNEYDQLYPTDYKYGNLELLIDDIVIEIKDESVAIIQETSPNNICSEQGAVSRPNSPLTCAPNYVVVTIINEAKTDDGDTEL